MVRGRRRVRDGWASDRCDKPAGPWPATRRDGRQRRTSSVECWGSDDSDGRGVDGWNVCGVMQPVWRRWVRWWRTVVVVVVVERWRGGTGDGRWIRAPRFPLQRPAGCCCWPLADHGRHECPTVHSCSGRHCWANPTMTASGEAAMGRSSKECRVGGRRRRGGDGSREQPRCVRRGGRRERRRKEDGGWEFSNFRRRLNVWGSTGAQGDWGCSWCQPLTLVLAAAQLLERCARTLCVHLRPAGRLPWPSGNQGTHAAISGRNWPDGALAPR